MTSLRGKERAISICLFGFKVDPEDIRHRSGSACVEIHRAGDRRGRARSFPKNFAAIWKPFNALEPWDTHIEILVDKIGGWTNLARLILDVSPEQAWLRLDIPVLGSPYIESNGFSAATMQEIAKCGLAFELAVRNFDDTEPTHRAATG